jgi:hypothetical protein
LLTGHIPHFKRGLQLFPELPSAQSLTFKEVI